MLWLEVAVHGEIYGGCRGDIWEIYGRYMGDIWEIYVLRLEVAVHGGVSVHVLDGPYDGSHVLPHL